MVDWSVAFTLTLAIVGAMLFEQYVLLPRRAGSLSPIQKVEALRPPQTSIEYVQQKYPNAFNA